MIKPRKSELVFEVAEDTNDGYVAECLTESIVTQGDNWDELRKCEGCGSGIFL
jgi:hypothetical protein